MKCECTYDILVDEATNTREYFKFESESMEECFTWAYDGLKKMRENSGPCDQVLFRIPGVVSFSIFNEFCGPYNSTQYKKPRMILNFAPPIGIPEFHY